MNGEQLFDLPRTEAQVVGGDLDELVGETQAVEVDVRDLTGPDERTHTDRQPAEQPLEARKPIGPIDAVQVVDHHDDAVGGAASGGGDAPQGGLWGRPRLAWWIRLGRSRVAKGPIEPGQQHIDAAVRRVGRVGDGPGFRVGHELRKERRLPGPGRCHDEHQPMVCDPLCGSEEAGPYEADDRRDARAWRSGEQDRARRRTYPRGTFALV